MPAKDERSRAVRLASDGERSADTPSHLPGRGGAAVEGIPASGRSRLGGRGVSIRDVAALAEVSPQTVSRVVRGQSNVREQTARRVREAMDQLGYVPNRAARALRSGTLGTIGVVGHQLSRTGEAHITEAVVAALREADRPVTLVDTPSSNPEDISRALEFLGQYVDGLIVLRLETPLAALSSGRRNLPIVLSDFRPSVQYTAVGSDQAAGTRAAVSHLLELGHETVHHIAGPTHSLQALARERAWMETLWETGRSVPPVFRGDWTPRSGYQLGQRIAENPDITAVYCANDEMALGLLRALYEAGRRVPDDVSVIGFDNLVAEWMWPPLTTISQDFAAVGRNLVSALLAVMEDPEGVQPQQILIPTQLIVRESTAPPRTIGPSTLHRVL
ncbi:MULTISPECIES: LacI family DNA-binding transcriptional regulator [unclassified Actinobaculum]|uniref:LacI family DNA-binding transcriptional regulator n=1 Tax=unclassified Actinobaculum TaxID=2609299 RepID=UPI000D526561|nr:MULTISPECIES: LacI family DNA-binding transcriptional regulator [unclassified Actinobaculum]AWE43297.1 LacI family transcriptional regulator [Actinobaculum sp. 313]RTE49808.1 LacI family DNA-binding transcriptional regulator [Actinobaculum sp. 352]